jgi:tRNA A37 threonylcarbamoyltransferase TsaD
MIAYAGAQRLIAGAPASDGVFTVRPRWDLSELLAA